MLLMAMDFRGRALTTLMSCLFVVLTPHAARTADSAVGLSVHRLRVHGPSRSGRDEGSQRTD